MQRDRHLASGDLCRESAPLGQGIRMRFRGHRVAVTRRRGGTRRSPGWVAEVCRYPRKANDFVLMENELRAVHELVLCGPGCRPFIEFHERLDIVERSIVAWRRACLQSSSGDTM